MKSKLLMLGITLLSVFQLFGQINTVGIIGSATANGWSESTPMEQVSENEWTLEIALTDGEVKFRANDDWEINWGARDFPRGTGEQGGPNIPVVAGNYTVFFNSETGEYFFDVDSEISMIGSATPGGWNDDTKMYPDSENPDLFTLRIELTQGEVKFRTTGDWTTNWGAEDFPVGVGVQGGPNIPIPIAGTYFVTFNRSSGEYVFEELVEFTTIGIIGSATAGGWSEDTPLTRDINNPDIWRGTVVLTDGELKFRANNDWSINWGGEDFPFGEAIFDGPNIEVTAGEYLVVFNPFTEIYAFFLVEDFETIGIIGSATPGGWENETKLVQDPDDKTLWSIQLKLFDGEAKFRANDDWDINWGSDEFPGGVGFQDGPNIPIEEGEYIITFNSATGEYFFELLEVFDFIGLIGRATPNDSWDDDYPMVRDAEDLNLWTVDRVELVDKASGSERGLKFRANRGWTINWGSGDWPSGTGRQDGPNIPIVDGTYRVVFNSVSGDYEFSDPLSTFSIVKSGAIHLYPNPARDMVTIELKSEELYGETTIQFISMSGEIVQTQRLYLTELNSVNVQSLKPGNYVMQFSNGKYFAGKKLLIAE
jgi:hypothetical protein